jgi:hypothetical protein
VKYFSILRSLDQRIFTPLSISASASRTAYFGREHVAREVEVLHAVALRELRELRPRRSGGTSR